MDHDCTLELQTATNQAFETTYLHSIPTCGQCRSASGSLVKAVELAGGTGRMVALWVADAGRAGPSQDAQDLSHYRVPSLVDASLADAVDGGDLRRRGTELVLHAKEAL